MTPRTRPTRLLALLLVTAPLLPALMACADNQTMESMLEPLFPPSPGQVAREAFNVYDADKRRDSVARLSATPFGGEDTYLRMYRLLLDDQDATVRAACIKALGEHGSGEDVPRIIPRLGDPAAFVRWEAAKALQRIHSVEAIAPLVGVLGNDEDPDVRMAAATALGQYPRSDVFYALVAALDDRDFGVARAGEQSLRTLTGQDLGTDGSAWLAWSRQEGVNLFAGKREYRWTPYLKPPSWVDRMKFWKAPPAMETRPARGSEAAETQAAGT